VVEGAAASTKAWPGAEEDFFAWVAGTDPNMRQVRNIDMIGLEMGNLRRYSSMLDRLAGTACTTNISARNCHRFLTQGARHASPSRRVVFIRRCPETVPAPPRAAG
jgi:hypothetical protein